MTRFNRVTYHPESKTADIGTGLIWDEVYGALEPYGVSVAGGRVTGVGAAGFTLGGGKLGTLLEGILTYLFWLGYSWLTNLHGLTVDTVIAFELVSPSGQVMKVTNESAPDLFFGLKASVFQ
jgi:FAD/FMN-containing dehydrogenase